MCLDRKTVISITVIIYLQHGSKQFNVSQLCNTASMILPVLVCTWAQLYGNTNSNICRFCDFGETICINVCHMKKLNTKAQNFLRIVEILYFSFVTFLKCAHVNVRKQLSGSGIKPTHPYRFRKTTGHYHLLSLVHLRNTFFRFRQQTCRKM